MLRLQDLARKNHAEKAREPRGQTSRGRIGRGAARFGVGRALPPARHEVRLQGRLLLVARRRRIEMDAAVRVQPDAVEVARDRIRHRHGLRPRNARNRAARVIVGAAAAICCVRELEVDEPAERAAVMRGMHFDPHAIAGLQRRLRPALARQHVDRPVLDLPNGLPAVRGGDFEEHPRVRIGPAEFRRRPRACAGCLRRRSRTSDAPCAGAAAASSKIAIEQAIVRSWLLDSIALRRRADPCTLSASRAALRWCSAGTGSRRNPCAPGA